MIDLVLHNQTRTKTYGLGFFRRIIDAAEPSLKLPRASTTGIGISLIGSARMRALNRQYRGKDTSTDVLSFPLSSGTRTGYTDEVFGDLFISPADVARKARQFGRTEREQMTWTVVHGLLHLAGYDHEQSAAAAEKMFSLEQRILKILKS